MATLGEMLASDGVCTREQIEDAIQNQIIMGGRTGTNLVELGFLDEKTLAGYLGRQHGLPFLAGEEVRPDPRALGLVRPEQAERWELIPFLVEGRRLQVLCVNPRNITALDELAFATGLKPDPILVTEMRFWKLLKKHYGIARALRHLVLEGRNFLSASLGEQRVIARQQPSAAPAEELISEDAFVRLYQRRDGFPTVRSEAAEAPESLPVLTAADLELVDEGAVSEPLDRRVWQQPEGSPARRAEDREAAEAAAAPPTFPPPVEADDTPLSFDEAGALLEGAGDRHAIARLVLRHARTLFSRSMLFTVHRNVLLGWDVIAEGLDRLGFRSLALPLDESSVFRQVVEARAHYLGALQKARVNLEFLRALGRKVPLSVFVMPILVRGRVVNVFYGDNGHKQHCSSDVASLLILAQRIGSSYVKLFERKKADFNRGDSASGDKGGRQK